MADDGLPAGAPSGFKYITPLRPALPTSTPAVAPAPAAPAGAPSGYRPPPPLAAAPAQGPPGYLGSTGATGGVPAPTPQADWSIDWSKGGEVKLPQSVQDWGNIAGNEATMGTIMSLRAQADAARQRLGPVTAASADVAGNVVSPTTLLNALPGGAPIAGAVHEGIKSYAAGNPWTTIADDTATGAISGFGGQLAAKAAPAVLPQLTKAGIELGPAAAMTAVAHKLFGEPYKDILTALGGYALTRNMSEGAAEYAKNIAASPLTQQAIKSLILGGSSAARTGLGPLDQLTP